MIPYHIKQKFECEMNVNRRTHLAPVLRRAWYLRHFLHVTLLQSFSSILQITTPHTATLVLSCVLWVLDFMQILSCGRLARELATRYPVQDVFLDALGYGQHHQWWYGISAYGPVFGIFPIHLVIIRESADAF